MRMNDELIERDVTLSKFFFPSTCDPTSCLLLTFILSFIGPNHSRSSLSAAIVSLPRPLKGGLFCNKSITEMVGKKGKGKGKKDGEWDDSDDKAPVVDFTVPEDQATSSPANAGEDAAPEEEVSDFMAQIMNASKKKQSRKKRKDDDFEAAISGVAEGEVETEEPAAVDKKGKGKGKKGGEPAAAEEPQAEPEEEEEATQKGKKGKKGKKNKEEEFWADIDKIQKGELEPEEKPQGKGKPQKQPQQQQEEDPEEAEGGVMSAAALKRKEKKERQKQQESQPEPQNKQPEKPAPTQTSAPTTTAPAPVAAASAAAAKKKGPAAAIKVLYQFSASL